MRTVIPQTGVQNFQIPKREIMAHRYSSCPGCAASLSMRHALKALGRKTILVIAQDWHSMADGPWTDSASDVPVFHTLSQTAASAASGVRAGLDLKGETDVQVLAWAGAGEGFKPSSRGLSEAAERAENFICVHFEDHSIVGAGGSQKGIRKDLLEILAVHEIPYVATATVAFPQDFIRKFKKARRIKGKRVILLHSPCPQVWKIPQNLTIEMARLAVHTKIFPLYEVENGRKYTVNVAPPEGRPVEEFIRPQGRFRHLTKGQMAAIQRHVDEEWECLMSRAGVRERPGSGIREKSIED
jgi:pyruvate/2-oxoacid:ferredoxin oxidoreductase beta subunit